MKYTTVTESKRLLKLGLKPESADLYYLIIADDEYSKYPQLGDLEDILREFPCWSGDRLSDLLPAKLYNGKYNIDLREDSNKYFQIAYGSWNIEHTRFNDMINTKQSQSFKEVCYDMLIWLLKNANEEITYDYN
jgi:hypothetical protein